MKTKFFASILAWGGVLLATSCMTDLERIAPADRQVVRFDQAPVFSVENGTIAIASESLLPELLAYFSSNNSSIDQTRSFSDDFTSLQTAYDAFVKLSIAAADHGYGVPIENLQRQYGQIAIISEDGTFKINTPVPHLACVLNERGEIIINHELYIYRDDRIIIIQDGDRSKAAYAERLNESVPQAGIFIYNIAHANQTSTRTDCETLLIGSSYGGSGSVTYISEPVWIFDDACDGNPDSRYRLRVTVYNIQTSAIEDLLMKVETFRRGAFGLWYATNNFPVNVTGSASLSGTNGAISNRSVAFFEDNDSDWTVRLLSNYPSLETTPAPPDLAAPAFYNQGCVTLNFTLTVPNGDPHNDCSFTQTFTRAI